MERAKTENRSAFAQAIKRREGAMREMLGMGLDPVRQVDADRRDMPLAVIWRIPGRGVGKRQERRQSRKLAKSPGCRRLKKCADAGRVRSRRHRCPRLAQIESVEPKGIEPSTSRMPF